MNAENVATIIVAGLALAGSIASAVLAARGKRGETAVQLDKLQAEIDAALWSRVQEALADYERRIAALAVRVTELEAENSALTARVRALEHENGRLLQENHNLRSQIEAGGRL